MAPPPNSASGPNPITVNGRTYSCAVGSTIDVPDFDHFVMSANGWTNLAGNAAVLATVGTTASRPANPSKGQTFHDATLNLTIAFDGKTWRNPATGAAV
ncbi:MULTISPECIES: hypothetical protein [unclassified Bradyrhizobium]|uniref:hypothetical protein n=1 Tax=unclassified Bradyrhizobium TaxID=2631580 RepID=UPI0028E7842E|nr:MULTISPECIES: hypothetical protein [unclassified Bradyrhizobium]